jgi:type II secretory pathway predicted ATPase ExeA
MEDRFLVDILLVGQPELQDRIREHPHMDSRIGLRFHLGQFVEDQTEAYIRHRLRIAGAVRELFTSAACSTVHEVTGGTPRRINTVCDLSLFEGATGGAAEVGEDLVRRVTA